MDISVHAKKTAVRDPPIDLAPPPLPKYLFSRNTPRMLLFASCDVMIFFFLATGVSGNVLNDYPPLYIVHLVSTVVIMMRLFEVSHGCIHRNLFSKKYDWLHDVFGNLAASILLMPFQSIRLAHMKHHTNTQHYKRDRLMPFINASIHIKPVPLILHVLLFPITVSLILPIAYGNQYNVVSGRLYDNQSSWCRIKGGFSILCNIAFLCDLHITFDTFSSFFGFYLFPFAIYQVMMFSYTYLQHRSLDDEDITVYGDVSWTWLKGQWHTKNIILPFGLDKITSYRAISDCHLVHHFYPTISPHHLPKVQEIVNSWSVENRIDLARHNFRLWFPPLTAVQLFLRKQMRYDTKND